MRTPRSIALAISGLLLVGAGTGAGVALARAQKPSSTAEAAEQTHTRTLGASAFLDDVAKRLGISRSKVDAALKALALDRVKWLEDNQFITKTVADRLRERIESGDVGKAGRLGLHGRLGLGLGKPAFGHVGLGNGLLKGHYGHGSGLLGAAATYLGMSRGELIDGLETKTLAQVTGDRGKSVTGLEQALRTAVKATLDDEVDEGDITAAQENALLQRFDDGIGDVVNGVPPALTDLAKRLGVNRSKLISAIKAAAIDQVNAALAKDLITKSRADAIKERIRSSPALPLGGIGFCGGQVGFGLGRFGSGFDHSGLGDDL